MDDYFPGEVPTLRPSGQIPFSKSKIKALRTNFMIAVFMS